MTRALAFLALLMLAWPTLAVAQDEGKPPAGQWFKSLQVPGMTGSCCDVSDCHRTASEFREGQWFAMSTLYPGDWVAVPGNRLLDERSIFADGVLCEAKTGNTDFQVRTLRGQLEFVYCFARPPPNA